MCLTLGLPHAPVLPRSQASPPVPSPSLQSKELSLKGQQTERKKKAIMGRSDGGRTKENGEEGPGLDHGCQGETKKQGHSSIPLGSASDLLGEEAKPAMESEESPCSPIKPGDGQRRGAARESRKELEKRDRKEVCECEPDSPRLAGTTEQTRIGEEASRP